MRLVSIGSVAALAVLLLLLNVSSPSEIGPLGILVVFFCLYVVLCGAVMSLLWGGHRVIARVAKSLAVRRPLTPMSAQRAYYFASILALGPVMLLGMQSVGGVDATGVGLVGLFMAIGCIYIAKRTVS